MKRRCHWLRHGRRAAGLLCRLPQRVAIPSSRDSNEIVLGHYASMTGSEATFGRSTDNGIQLAVEEINEAGGVNGKKVRVITYDDKGDAREAGTAVTRLVTRDGVVAVLGEVASSLSLVGAPVCQENGVPMVTPSSTNPDSDRSRRHDLPRLLHRSVSRLGVCASLPASTKG